MKRETLGQRQRRFTLQIAKLIVWAYEELGVQLTMGDAFRDPRVHGPIGTKKGYGRRSSNHKAKLAQDLNLFTKDGEGKWRYRPSTKAHQAIGEKWESMGEDHAWGGHFNDGNHYSFKYQGRR
jgi:hypothetical protein